MAKARCTSSTVAFGTVPISCSVYGLKTSMTRSRWTRLAADPHRLAAQFPGIHAVAPVVVAALATTPMKFLPRTPSSALVIMRADSASVTP